MNTVTTTVRAIAWTHFDAAAAEELTDGWTTDTDGGPALAEFAGRACYQSWTKPNPATATNAGYIGHILDVGHLSVLEHGTATLYLAGVSRSFTHELVRHRHFSYSQLSQRYVSGKATAMVEPDVIAADTGLHRIFEQASDAALRAYTDLVEELEDRALRQLDHRCLKCSGSVRYDAGGPVCFGVCAGYIRRVDVEHAKLSTGAKKAARQAARAVLPNAAETRIVVTGNYRAWRHFIDMRATEHADVEIRAVAVACLRELHRVAPNVFNDYEIISLADGSLAAVSMHAERS